MYRKKFTLVLSIALLFSFFTPLFNWHSFEMNGMNYILSEHISPYKYLLLVIPISALVLFLKSMNEENYLHNISLVSALPFLTSVVVFLAKYFTKEPDSDGNIFSEINPWFWVMLAISILLILINRKDKIYYD